MIGIIKLFSDRGIEKKHKCILFILEWYHTNLTILTKYHNFFIKLFVILFTPINLINYVFRYATLFHIINEKTVIYIHSGYLRSTKSNINHLFDRRINLG
jgi:hypothetical protein